MMVIFHKESDYLLISIIQEGRLFRRQREKATTNKQTNNNNETSKTSVSHDYTKLSAKN